MTDELRAIAEAAHKLIAALNKCANIQPTSVLDASRDLWNSLAALEAERAAGEARVVELTEAFLETREFLGLLEPFVCEWSCPSTWKTADGQPHSKLHKDFQEVLFKHEATRDAALAKQEPGS